MLHPRKKNRCRGVARGRVPGVLEPPFWVMKMNIIQEEKSIGTPLSKFREKRFSFLKKSKGKSI